MVVDGIVAGDELGLVGVDDRQNAVRPRVERGLARDAVPIVVSFFENGYLELRKVPSGGSPCADSS